MNPHLSGRRQQTDGEEAGARTGAGSLFAARGEPEAGWDLAVGSAPAPKAGRALPGHISIWWNENVVVVVRDGPPDLNADAREAFLGL